MACSRWSSVWIPMLNFLLNNPSWHLRFFQAKMPLNLYFQAKMPLNLAFADPNYLDVATKKRVTDEVNLEVYISYFCICPPNWKCYELRLKVAFTNPGDVAPFWHCFSWALKFPACIYFLWNFNYIVCCGHCVSSWSTAVEVTVVILWLGLNENVKCCC